MFIVVGVTGGIAAYKAVNIVRLLVKAGHDVHVVPTDDALRFVGLPTWEATSRNPVTTSVHDDVPRVRIRRPLIDQGRCRGRVEIGDGHPLHRRVVSRQR